MNVQKFIRALKLGLGCVDCGFNSHPAALDFDHIKGVKVVQLSQCTNMEQALKEIEKCEVRCANCHRIKTAERIYDRTPNNSFFNDWVIEVLEPHKEYTVKDLVRATGVPESTVKRYLRRSDLVGSLIKPGSATRYRLKGEN